MRTIMTKRLLPIILLSFVNVIGFSILIPVLPEIIQYHGLGDLQSLWYGGLLSAYAFSQFLAAPLLGTISDKYGRRLLLIVSQIGTIASWVIFAAAYFIEPELSIGIFNIPLVIIAFSRIVDGLTGGNISIANAWISDMTTAKEKTKAFSLMGGAFGIGFLIGPVLGGLSAATSYGYLGTVLLAFIISVITLLAIIFYLPESLPKEKRQHNLEIHLWRDINIFNKFYIFDKAPVVKNLLSTRIVFSIIFASFTTLVTLMLEEEYGLSPLGLGAVFSSIGIMAIFNQLVIVPKMARKIGDIKSFYIGLVILCVGLATLAPIPPVAGIFTTIGMSLVVFFVNIYVVNLGITLSLTTFKTIITTHTHESEQGIATGIDDSINALGQGISPIVAGFIYTFITLLSFPLLAILLASFTGHAYLKNRHLIR